VTHRSLWLGSRPRPATGVTLPLPGNELPNQPLISQPSNFVGIFVGPSTLYPPPQLEPPLNPLSISCNSPAYFLQFSPVISVTFSSTAAINPG
jgi:hypothetical protein